MVLSRGTFEKSRPSYEGWNEQERSWRQGSIHSGIVEKGEGLELQQQ